jgi:hypothetical protein
LIAYAKPIPPCCGTQARVGASSTSTGANPAVHRRLDRLNEYERPDHVDRAVIDAITTFVDGLPQ